METAKAMNYVPNISARALKNSVSKSIGVALEKSLYPSRFHLLLQGIRDGAEEKGYNILLCSFKHGTRLYPDYVNSALEHKTDGVIYISSDNAVPARECEEMILQNQIPFVAFDCQAGKKEYTTVDLD